MKSSVDKKTLLYGIIFLGIILRVWGISFGLPYQFHQDESIIVNHAMAYGTGDLNPHFFSIPPFTSYLVFIFYGVMFILGKFIGIWNSAYNFALHFFKDPTIFYLAGRFLIGVIPGVGCIYYTYRISRKFFTEKTALYAAAVMAVSFLNVINSHYIYTDMILVFFILLATDGIYSIYRRGSWKDYCRAGILIGLAVGTKYNGALLLVPYCVTHFVLAKSEGMNFRKLFLAGKFWIGLLCVMGVFVVVNPFSVLDHQVFFSSVLKQGGAFSATGWKHHIFYSLAEGFSWRLTVCGIVGLILIFKKNTWGKILISFPLAYYVVLVFKSQSFARYVLPIVPFLSIGCGYLFFNFLPETLLEKKKNVKIFVISVAILVLVPMIYKSVTADILFSSKDTRIEAAEWIKENLPPNTKIACDSTTFRPALDQPYSQIIQKRDFLTKQAGLKGLKTRKLEFVLKVSNEKDLGYPIYFLFEFPEKQGQFLDTIPAISYSVEALRAKGINYVIINGQLFDNAKADFLKELIPQSEIVKDFSPYKDDVYRESRDPVSITCLPVMGRELFLRKKTGPSLRIYKII